MLPGCKNYEHEAGEKWIELLALLPDLEVARGFTDGALSQYQQRETTHGTSRSFADLGVCIFHDVHEKFDFKGPWDAYGKVSTESRRRAVRNRTAIINNAYLHAKHNAQACLRAFVWSPHRSTSRATPVRLLGDHRQHPAYRRD